VYFVSNRPVDEGRSKTDDDIWRYRLTGDERLEHLSVNSDAQEYSPVVTTNGTLYFASDRDGGFGQGDLYSAAASGDDFGEPQVLSDAVNSIHGEWNLWVAADECELLFEASGRPTNVSTAGDLYYSKRTASGWTEAAPISAVNTDGSDLMPRLHPDGRTLYYTAALPGGHAQIVIANPDGKPLSTLWSETTAPKPGSPMQRCQG